MLGRNTGAVLVAAALLAGSLAGPAAAGELDQEDMSLQLTSEQAAALDSTALEEVSGGAIVAEPGQINAWREEGRLPSVLDAQGFAQPAGSTAADAGTFGAGLGARPPGGDAAVGAGAIAGDIANTIF